MNTLGPGSQLHEADDTVIIMSASVGKGVERGGFGPWRRAERLGRYIRGKAF